MSPMTAFRKKFLGGAGVVTLGSVPNLESSAVSSRYKTELAVSIRRIVGGGTCARLGQENAAAHRVAARAVFDSVVCESIIFLNRGRREAIILSSRPPD